MAERKDQFEVENYWTQIRNLYQNGQFIIADSVDAFDRFKHDGLIHNQCLYFRGQSLARFFQKVNFSEIIEELSRQGILNEGTKNRSKQISALNGLRFYVIPLSKLH